MALAAAFGVPLFTYLADAYGRKTAIIALSVPQAVSFSFSYFRVYIHARYFDYIETITITTI